MRLSISLQLICVLSFLLYVCAKHQDGDFKRKNGSDRRFDPKTFDSMREIFFSSNRLGRVGRMNDFQSSIPFHNVYQNQRNRRNVPEEEQEEINTDDASNSNAVSWFWSMMGSFRGSQDTDDPYAITSGVFKYFKTVFNGLYSSLSGASVCYGDLGCFNTSTFVSARRPVNFLPEPPQHVQTEFFLYTRVNNNTLQKLNASNTSTIETSNFNGYNPTKFIVHGFTENGHSYWMRDMKSELLKHGNYNVILVNWGGGSRPPYTQATANARLVGAEIAKLIKTLQSSSNARPEDMHIIGHSLGAHVAGYAGERIANLSRISGLDPAEPFFQYTEPFVRLDPSDATFVDVIHTDGDSILNLGFGLKQNVGHADFYPNGGNDQPGCDELDKTARSTDRLISCSHARATKLFTESINSNCEFKAFKCDSLQNLKHLTCANRQLYARGSFSLMGFHADRLKPPRGANNKYYLETLSATPYCGYTAAFEVTLGGSETLQGTMYASFSAENGQSEEMELKGHNKLVPGQSYYFFYLTPKLMGTPRGVKFRWVQQTSSSWYPTDWNIFKSVQKLYLRTVAVHTPSEQYFCLQKKIEEKKTVTLKYPCSYQHSKMDYNYGETARRQEVVEASSSKTLSL